MCATCNSQQYGSMVKYQSVDVHVAGFSRTGCAACGDDTPYPGTICFPPVSFWSLAYCLVSRRREWLLRPATSSVAKTLRMRCEVTIPLRCVAVLNFSPFVWYFCLRTSYLIIVKKRLLLLADIDAAHRDVRVVPYFVHPDFQRVVLGDLNFLPGSLGHM